MITPEDLIRLAETLALGPREPEWRSAVSRAYYGAFHAGRRLLRDLNFRVPRASVAHAYVWMRLSNCGNATIEQAGGHLNHLQGLRNEADYDIHLRFDQSDAQLWVQRAGAILQAIATGLVEPTRTQITAAIRDYERNVLGSVTWQGP
jgi:uncharacterized protein (UPF0332 family)